VQDKNIDRKKGVLNSLIRTSFAPKIIEFSSSGLCNRKCVFCPRSSSEYKHTNSHIEASAINKIAHELADYPNDYFFLFSGFSEPLISKDLEEWIGILRSKHKNSRIEINTNTDLLNKRRVHKLIDSGLSAFICSIYDSEERAQEVEQLFKECGLTKDKYELRRRFLKKDLDGEEALKEFGITLSNRGGTMDKAAYSIQSLREPLINECYYPFYTLFMDYNGDYLICPHDWGKNSILGNVDRDHIIKDIWQGDKMEKFRKSLLVADRTCSASCAVCDVEGTMMGGNEVEEWKQWTELKKH